MPEEKDYNLIWARLIIIALCTLLVLCLLAAFDIFAMNSRNIINITLSEECDYPMPKGWQIVTDGKMFAVKSPNNEYLCEGRYAVTTYHATISEPTLLFSECKARAYMKRYAEEHWTNHAKNFKPIE